MWFLIKYFIISFIVIIGIIYVDVSWWNEDSRRLFLLLLCWSASHGPALVSYLEYGDWLTWKKD